MTQIIPTIRPMTPTEARHYQLQTLGLILHHNTISYRLLSGTKDNISVFKSGPVLYVLTINHHLDYIGFDVYLGSEDEPIDSLFLQGDYAIKEIVGDDWNTLPLSTLATRLQSLFA